MACGCEKNTDMSDLKDKIDKRRMPEHIAIIMDGNGRWAKKQGKERLYGHMSGVESVRNITETAVALGLRYLTLYTFSTENWNRPKQEVDGLMDLLVENIVKETPTFHKNNIRFTVIGDTDMLPEEARVRLNECITDTSAHTGLTLILALSYSSRWEITRAARLIAEKVARGEMNPADIDEQVFSQHLATAGIPDPDLVIRTGGEFRISNYLLWQSAYAELYFTDVYWPEFRADNLYQAIIDYQQRERRFGKTSEQIA